MSTESNILKAVVIDDEPNAINNIKIIVQDYCDGVEIVGTADSVLEGIKVINKTKPNVLFLDIEMPYGTGFDIIEAIPHENMHIIFITAYDNYAIRAIKANAIDYIMKPIDIDEFIAAIEKVKTKEKESNILHKNTPSTISQIAVPISRGIRTIPVDFLLYLEAEGSYSKLHLIAETPLLISRNLKQFDEALPNDMFFRIHHSIIINVKQVVEYNKRENTVVLTGNIELEISRRRKDEFIEFMQNTAKFI